MTIKRHVLGKQYELTAVDYLKHHGIYILTQNFKSRFGEIDIVAKNNDILLFIEVRYRSSMAFGGALASITYKKKQRLLYTARYYLACNPQFNNYNCRFDLLAMQTIDKMQESLQIEWVQDIIESS